MEVPETHEIILIVTAAFFMLIVLYELYRTRCNGICGFHRDPESGNKSASCEKLEEPPPSYESLFP
jgi:hypothetical protein